MDSPKITLAELAPLKLDKNSLHLLAELDKNGRVPLSVIAKRIGISRENAHYRFSKLKDEGIIEGFKLFVNYLALGYKCYDLLLDLENLGDSTREDIVSYLRTCKNVSVKTYVLSKWDIEIRIWVKDDSDFYSFYNAFFTRNKDFIVDKKLFVVTAIHGYSHSYLHGSLSSATLQKPKTPIHIDDIDEKLLQLLFKDPRRNLIELSEKLDISATTVAYRIKRFYKSKIIIGCMPRLNLSRIGWTRYRVEVLLNNPAQKGELVSYLAAHASILRVYELIGPMDLAFEGDFGSAMSVDSFLHKLKTKIPAIRDFDVRAIVRQ